MHLSTTRDANFDKNRWPSLHASAKPLRPKVFHVKEIPCFECAEKKLMLISLQGFIARDKRELTENSLPLL